MDPATRLARRHKLQVQDADSRTDQAARYLQARRERDQAVSAADRAASDAATEAQNAILAEQAKARSQVSMAERAVMEAQSNTSRVEQMAELEIKKATLASGSQDDVVKAERQIFNLERSKLEHRLQEAQSTELAQAEAIERHREEVASASNSRITSARSPANAEAILT